MQVEQVELNKKILYHFTIFATINEKLIAKDPRISVHSRDSAKRDNLLFTITKGAAKQWEERCINNNSYARIASLFLAAYLATINNGLSLLL